MKIKNPKDRIIFALDVPKLDRKTHVLLNKLEGKIKTIKVGLELFSRYGISVLDELEGFDIFLDLKLDDVPTTITRTIANLAHTNIKFLTLQGECDTLLAAMKGWKKRYGDPTFLHVPMLSSREFTFNPSMEEYYLKGMVKQGQLCTGNKIGYIASGDRIKSIREESKKCIIVSPGVRLPSGEKGEQKKDDHKKLATPAEAIKAGADYIVVGRPIRDAKSPIKAIAAIVKNLKEGV